MYSETDYGRQLEEHSEGDSAYRSPFRRDYARVIHSPSFRRLQGKTQLFPGADSDYFRNRLTHSLEVAQIAESVAYKLNHEQDRLGPTPIDPKVPVIAGVAHDLGHPPFGHNGEKALDDCMKSCGGFEGNAQTLRIVSTLEKKRHSGGDGTLSGVDENGNDQRRGLNLTYRAAASILKYDKQIPNYRDADAELVKGYYQSDTDFVKEIKKAVCGDPNLANFKTVECQIMDVADDIAYSTYDIDDAFKGGFLTPLDVLSATPELLESVAERVSQRLVRDVDTISVVDSLAALFDGAVFPASEGAGDLADTKYAAVKSYEISRSTAKSGFLRSQLTSELIDRFISGVRYEHNEDCPPLSKVFLDEDTALLVEVLKVFSFEATIMSPRLKVSESRGYEIILTIFEALDEPDGNLLLPDDFRLVFERMPDGDDGARKRVLCDFIAGMTDRYAVEFYGRLQGDTHRSIFTPL